MERRSRTAHTRAGIRLSFCHVLDADRNSGLTEGCKDGKISPRDEETDGLSFSGKLIEVLQYLFYLPVKLVVHNGSLLFC